MIVMPVAQAVASALIFTVAGSCARNMMQTANVRKQFAVSTTTPFDNPLESLGNENLSDCLQTLSRTELLQVFANGRAPTASELGTWFSSEEYCEWDAMLLDNDGIIMNASPNFFTHQLFGGKLLPWRLMGEASNKKGRWNGKAFGKPTSRTGGTGSNRFSSIKTNSNFLRHTFDYDISDSQILQGGRALRLDYWRYQSLPISLWWSMHDELRVVDAPSDDQKIVLIGMGWMGWSGGALNCSPFLLERSR